MIGGFISGKPIIRQKTRILKRLNVPKNADVFNIHFVAKYKKN